MVDCQNTFPKHFVESQSRFSNYQRFRDQRLSMPKHQRRRLADKFSIKSPEQERSGDKSKSHMQLYTKAQQPRRKSIVHTLQGRNKSIYNTLDQR